MYLTLNDGTTMSVQASSSHYCTPRIDNAPTYSEVEIGFPSKKVERLMPYAENRTAPTDTVYGWVPVSVLATIVKEAGGIKEVQNPSIRLKGLKF